jgi:flagellar FliL protein
VAKKKEQETGGKKKGGLIKKLLVLIILLGVLGGGGFAGWKFFWLPRQAAQESSNQTAETPAEEKQQLEVPPASGQMVTLDPLVVNLADPMGRRYLKITLDVEVINEAAVADLGTAMPKVKDTLLLLLSSKSYEDIGSMDRKLELKNEIVDRLNLILGKGRVLNIYFTEFVVQ